MAIHYFNTEVAKELGILPAVLLQNIDYWCEKNKANGKHLHDGYFWTYNSKKAFSELFSYATPRQITYALEKLKEEGYIIAGNYNQMAYDRTLWYALTENGKCILQNCQMEVTKLSNGSDKIVQPIPDNKPNNKTTNNKPNSKHKHGEYSHVLLTDDELLKLRTDYSNSDELIKFLDEYIEMKGYKAKSHYLAIKKWVVDAVKERKPKQQQSIADIWRDA